MGRMRDESVIRRWFMLPDAFADGGRRLSKDIMNYSLPVINRFLLPWQPLFSHSVVFCSLSSCCLRPSYPVHSPRFLAISCPCRRRFSALIPCIIYGQTLPVYLLTSYIVDHFTSFGLRVLRFPRSAPAADFEPVSSVLVQVAVG